MRKNLIIVRAGDQSLHRQWLGEERNFDLFISYFGDDPESVRHEAEYLDSMKGPRWPAHNKICRERWAEISRYEYVAFACDDLAAKTETWNRLFIACHKYQMHLAQPAITGWPNISITRPRRNCLARYTDFVEVMCPVFQKDTLKELKGTFAESRSGWGLEYIWSNRLPWPDYRMGIIDEVKVAHTQPGGGSGALYEVLRSANIDPMEEKVKIGKRYGLEDYPLVEHARIVSNVNSRFHKVTWAFYLRFWRWGNRIRVWLSARRKD